MKYFIFRNPGVIDPRSITTFGVSSKDNEKTAIGFFGTGLKYAIAVILRTGGGITIYSGGKKYSFGILKETIRHDEFNIVTMGEDDEVSHPLAFTTELGKGWEVWQAFRELHCNMVDEGGENYECDEHATDEGMDDDTTYVVVQGSAFEQAWMQRASIVLNTKPLHETPRVNIHHGKSEYVYYRGIRTHKLHHASRYTYNITEKMELTEDRTFKSLWYCDHYIQEAISGLTDEHLIEELITIPDVGAEFEGRLAYSLHAMSEKFKSTAMKLMREFHRTINRSVTDALREHNFEVFVSDDTASLNKIDLQRMAVALSFLSELGYEVDYPIVVSKHIGENVLGRAYNGKIYIAKPTFDMGTKMLAGTILEEYIHLKHKLYDESRGLQNFLLNALMSAGEQATGQIL
jgi:hypothetical protein